MPRTLATLLLLTALTGAPAATWFVAPTGDDTATGTQDRPWASLQRAQQTVAPGDTVYVRGGTYRLTEAQIARRYQLWADVIWLDKSGTPEQPIRYEAYGDERPVFDLSAVKPANLRVNAFWVTGSWLVLKRLEVVGVQVTIKTHTQSICFASEGSHNRFEQLSMHDGQGIGLYHTKGSDNLFLNCDAYRNHDYTSEDGKGGNADGFGCHPTAGSTGNVFRGCRAWFNSDDGFDCISAREAVTFDHCWAFYNGFGPRFERLADGNGFKAGGWGSTPVAKLPPVIPRHTVQYCLAARNKASGFYANHHLGGDDWFRNTAWRNGADFNLLGRLPDNKTDVPGKGHVLRDNLAYGGRALLVNCAREQCTLEHNLFGVGLTDADFASVDEAQLTAPRQADGSLPVLTFMRPVPGGKAVGFGALGE